MSAPVLWQYNFSSFNEKARWALDFDARAPVSLSRVPGLWRADAADEASRNGLDPRDLPPRLPPILGDGCVKHSG